MENEPPNILEQQRAAVTISNMRMLLTHGYTGDFTFTLLGGLAFLVTGELHNAETSQILISFGLNSILWGWLWLIGGALLTWWLAGRLARNFYFMRVVRHYKDPTPLGHIEAGVSDISVWSCLLTYLPILFLAGLAPGKLGLLRPPVIVLTSMCSASVLSVVLTNGMLRLLYGTSKERKTISRKQCEMTSGRGARCGRWAFRARFRGANRPGQPSPKEFCRWHAIVIVTAQRYIKTPRVAVTKQRQAAFYLLMTVIGLRYFMLHHQIMWLALGVLTFGSALLKLSDSIMSAYHALSKLAVWAQLAATGVTLEVIGGITLLVLIGLHPELIQVVGTYPEKLQVLLAFAPAVIFIAITLVTAGALDALTRRILFFDFPSLAPLFVLATFLSLWHMLSSVVPQVWPFNVWLSERFWSELIGTDFERILGVAFVLNWGLFFTLLKTRADKVRATGRAYLVSVASILGPMVLAFVSLMSSRFLLLSVGLTGPTSFIVVTLLLSLVLSVLLLRLSTMRGGREIN